MCRGPVSRSHVAITLGKRPWSCSNPSLALVSTGCLFFFRPRLGAFDFLITQRPFSCIQSFSILYSLNFPLPSFSHFLKIKFFPLGKKRQLLLASAAFHKQLTLGPRCPSFLLLFPLSFLSSCCWKDRRETGRTMSFSFPGIFFRVSPASSHRVAPIQALSSCYDQFTFPHSWLPLTPSPGCGPEPHMSSHTLLSCSALEPSYYRWLHFLCGNLCGNIDA